MILPALLLAAVLVRPVRTSPPPPPSYLHKIASTVLDDRSWRARYVAVFAARAELDAARAELARMRLAVAA